MACAARAEIKTNTDCCLLLHDSNLLVRMSEIQSDNSDIVEAERNLNIEIEDGESNRRVNSQEPSDISADEWRGIFSRLDSVNKESHELIIDKVWSPKYYIFHHPIPRLFTKSSASITAPCHTGGVEE